MHAELSLHSLSVTEVVVAGRSRTSRPAWRWPERCGTLISRRHLARMERWVGERQEETSYAADKTNSSFKMSLLRSTMDLTWCSSCAENSGKIWSKSNVMAELTGWVWGQNFHAISSLLPSSVDSRPFYLGLVIRLIIEGLRYEPVIKSYYRTKAHERPLRLQGSEATLDV